MRVLYVTSGFPYPLTSGYLRHYHLAGALARAGHDVTLASLVGQATSPGDIAEMGARVSRVITARRTRSRAWRSGRRIAELAGVAPAEDVRALVRAIRGLEARYDVAIVSGKRTAPVLGAIDRRAPVIVDLCDATSERLEGMAATKRGLDRGRTMLELRHVQRAERRLVGRASTLLVASERDRTAMSASGVDPSRLVVLPNGVDADYWARRTNALHPGVIVMSGVMSYEPNADAAWTLLHDILPIVRATLPATRLVLVGRDPGPGLQSAARDDPAVAVTGFVDDVRPHLEQAAVFAAPLRFGAGIQNKVLEAMAMAIPAVTSSLAAQGLAIDGAYPPVRVADDSDAFARHLVVALHQAAEDARPDSRGRDYVVEHFSWERSGARLVELLELAVAAR